MKMLGLENTRGGPMESAFGYPGMRDSFQRHYPGFNPANQSGYPAPHWPPEGHHIAQAPGPGAPAQQSAIQSATNSGPNGYITMHHYQQVLPNSAPPCPGMVTGDKLDTKVDQTNSGGGKANSKAASKAGSTASQKGERFSYTRYQLELLSGVYERIRYPNPTQKQLISKRVGITKEQVKIWFQNRRRKDITGKSVLDSSGHVPDDVMQSVLEELLKHDKEPKGKKTTTSMKEFQEKVQARKRAREDGEGDDSHDSSNNSKRSRPNSESFTTTPSPHTEPVATPTDRLSAGNSPVENQQISTECAVVYNQGLNTQSPYSHSTGSTSFHSDHSAYQIPSVESSNPSTPYSTDESNLSVASPLPPVTMPTTAPSAQLLDMNAPPNAIALPLETASLERPRSLESPALGPHIEGAGLGFYAERNPDDVGNSRETEKPPKEVAPNTVAPPSEKLNFYVAKLLSKASAPLSINIPKSVQSSTPTNTHSNTSTVNSSANTSGSCYSSPDSVPHHSSHYCPPFQQQWSPQNQAYNTPSTMNNDVPYTPLGLQQHHDAIGSGSSLTESLVAHYEKLLAPYMLQGYLPNAPHPMQTTPYTQPDSNFPYPSVPGPQSNMYNTHAKHYMMHNPYALPFGTYTEFPSDLSMKKHC